MNGKAAIPESVAAAPQHYLWWFPGSPIMVHLDLRVVERLHEQLREMRQEGVRQGLLFGRHLGTTTEILDFQPVFGQELSEAVAMRAQEQSDRQLVGYYRSEAGGMLRPNENDLSLLELHFPKTYQVFLLIQSNGFGPPSATFFFHGGDLQIPDVALLEFPFDAGLLSMEERQRIKRSRQPAMEQGVVKSAALPEAHSAPKSRIRRATWLLFAVVLVALGVPTAAWLFRNQLSRAWSAFQAAQPAASPSRTGSVYSMSLRARRQNGDLELTWDRESEVVRAAVSGMLSVLDGELRLQIPLDAAQVRSGSVLYVPSTDRIQIQFTVTTPERASTESVMVLVPKVGAPRTQSLGPARISAAPVPPVEAPSDHSTPVRATRPFIAPTMTQPSGSGAAAEDPPMPTASPNVGIAVSLPSSSQAPSVPPPAASGSQTAAQQPVAHLQPEFHPPVAITQAKPVFPTGLRSVALKPLTIGIRVAIDRRGKVTRAEPLSAGSAHKLFVDEAVHAARLWRFLPARRGEEPVESEIVLQFVFKQ